MSGTREGGLKCAAAIKANDPEFYRRMGALGGKKSRTGGFASDEIGSDGLTGRQRARVVGALGGRISRRITG